LILDTAPDGRWVLRVRAGGSHWCLAPQSDGWRYGREVTWRLLDPVHDDALPGQALLQEDSALAAACGLDRIHRKTVVQYRVGRRAVARIEGTRGANKNVVYAKLLRGKQAARALDRFETIERSGIRLFVTPRSIDTDQALLVFDEVDGQQLHDALWRSGTIPLARVAASLRILAAEGDAGLPVSEINPAETAIRQLRKGSVLIPELGVLRDSIARAEAELAVSALDQPASGGVYHGDLHDKQIFLTDRGVRLIDADGVSAGSPEWDWVNLIEHMRLRGLQGAPLGPAAAAELQRTLGFERERRNLLVLRTLVRARLAGVYALRPWWWEVSMRLQRDAERGLEDLGVMP
jgi:hypothetical protein